MDIRQLFGGFGFKLLSIFRVKRRVDASLGLKLKGSKNSETHFGEFLSLS